MFIRTRTGVLVLAIACACTIACQEQSSPDLDRSQKMLASLSLDDDEDYLAPELDKVLALLKQVPPTAREDHREAQALIVKITATRNRVARQKAREAAAAAAATRRAEIEELAIERRDAVHQTKRDRRLARRKCGGRYHNDGVGNCVRGKVCAEHYIFRNGKCWLGI